MSIIVICTIVRVFSYNVLSFLLYLQVKEHLSDWKLKCGDQLVDVDVCHVRDFGFEDLNNGESSNLMGMEA